MFCDGNTSVPSGVQHLIPSPPVDNKLFDNEKPDYLQQWETCIIYFFIDFLKLIE
jgi:hypothetical protein